MLLKHLLDFETSKSSRSNPTLRIVFTIWGLQSMFCVCEANGSAKTFETWLRGVALGCWFKMFLHRKKVPGSLATICGRQYIQCVFGLLNSSGLMKFMMCLQYMFLSGIWDSEMTMHAFSQVPKPHGILNGSAKYNGDVSTLLGGWSCFDPNISKSKSTLHLTMVSCWTLRSGYILLNCKNTCTISLLGFQSSMGRRPQDFFLDFGIPNKCISCGRAAQVW